MKNNKKHCKISNAKLAIMNILYEAFIFIHIYHSIANFQMLIGRQVPREPRLARLPVGR